MTVIAAGTIAGHEARGECTIVNADGRALVQLRNLWIAPGAPDVRLYISPRSDGHVDDTATELGKISDHQSAVDRELPDHIDPRSIGSVIIQCTVFSVLFGFGPVSPTTPPTAQPPTGEQ